MFIENWHQFGLVLEGKLETSPKFKDIIRIISFQSPLAKNILNFINSCEEIEDAALKQNFVDIVPGKDDTVSFIPQPKFNQIIQKDPSAKAFTTKGRSELKIGRFLKAVCELGKIKCTDKQIEEVVNIFKSLNVIGGDEEMGLVNGDDIQFWYNGENYLNSHLGELGNSCMKGRNCRTFFKLYTKNPEKVMLLILTKKDEDDEKKLIGRALVWKLDESPTSCKIFMDRVYCAKGSDHFKFISYAEKNGWMYKAVNNSTLADSLLFKYKGENYEGKIVVNLIGKAPSYPFMDTFTFLNPKKDQISNIGYLKGYVMEDTSGDLGKCGLCDGTGIDPCDNCNGTGYEPCEECNGRKIVTCPECDGDGEVTKPCKECHGNRHVECERCNGEGEVVGKSGKKVKCKNCEGYGEIVCTSCNGRGGITISCPECDGAGTITCPECHGKVNKGKVCEECHGEKGHPCKDCVDLMNNDGED